MSQRGKEITACFSFIVYLLCVIVLTHRNEMISIFKQITMSDSCACYECLNNSQEGLHSQCTIVHLYTSALEIYHV